MTNDANTSILARIKKLLALGSKANPNDHERERAMEAAQALADKHNLDLAQARDHEAPVDTTSVGTKIAYEQWVCQLLHGACKLYYTASISTPTTRWYSWARLRISQ